MSHHLNVDFVQGNAHVGRLDLNLEEVLRQLARSRADLVVFPECFLTGYPLQDLVGRPGFLAEVDNTLDRLAAKVRELGQRAVLIGAPIAGTDLPFNAAVLIRPDGSRQVVVKTELPNNDVFDERRTFARGGNTTPMTLGDWKLGVMICEDMWHGPVGRRLADEGADLLIAINGSPMEMDKQPIRVRHARRRVRDTGLPLVYLNLVGGQDELVFDGGSFVLDSRQNLIEQHPFDPCVFSACFIRDTDGSVEVETKRENEKSLTAYPGSEEAIWRSLVLGLGDYVRKNGFTDVLLGLSGGLDSAVVAAIGADALGHRHVITLMLPAKWTGQESQTLADEMAQHCRFRHATVPVSAITESLDWALEQAIGGVVSEDEEEHIDTAVAKENIQARARGNLIMALSNARPGTLVLSTGNKSEMSVGYATLYGDMCGGFNPIKDLYKTQVQDLAAWRNRLSSADLERMGFAGTTHPIPNGILSRPPSAELGPGQTDEHALGTYPVLDAVLRNLIEERLDPESAARAASNELGKPVDIDYAKRIAVLVRRAEYKRRQAPPGIKVSGRSFGFGWRYPITNGASL